jgi:tripartite-type tricarboxylate transporter receptor subunit TctC
MQRKTALKVMLGALATPFLTSNAFAQKKGPIKFIVGYGAGGTTDLCARLFAQKMGKYLGDEIIIENKPGGNTLIANRLAAKSPADGKHFLVGPMSSTIFREIMQPAANRGYSMLTDYRPVATLTTYPMGLMVSANLGVNTLQEFVELLKKNPSLATFGCSALGSHTHLLAELFGKKIGLKILAIPYQSNSHVVTALMGDQLPAAMVTATEMNTNLNNSKVKVLGIMTEERSSLTPNVPTFREQGIDAIGGDAWMGIWAPSKTPDSEINKINDALQKVFNEADLEADLLSKLSVSSMFRTTNEMLKLQDRDMQMWKEIIKASGFSA